MPREPAIMIVMTDKERCLFGSCRTNSSSSEIHQVPEVTDVAFQEFFQGKAVVRMKNARGQWAIKVARRSRYGAATYRKRT